MNREYPLQAQFICSCTHQDQALRQHTIEKIMFFFFFLHLAVSNQCCRIIECVRKQCQKMNVLVMASSMWPRSRSLSSVILASATLYQVISQIIEASCSYTAFAAFNFIFILVVFSAFKYGVHTCKHNKTCLKKYRIFIVLQPTAFFEWYLRFKKCREINFRFSWCLKVL